MPCESYISSSGIVFEMHSNPAIVGSNTVFKNTPFSLAFLNGLFVEPWCRYFLFLISLKILIISFWICVNVSHSDDV